MELLELFGCDSHGLEIFATDRPGELVVIGGPGWPHRCEICNSAWVQARSHRSSIDTQRPHLIAVQ